jgi:hypothetical protein
MSFLARMSFGGSRGSVSDFAAPILLLALHPFFPHRTRFLDTSACKHTPQDSLQDLLARRSHHSLQLFRSYLVFMASPSSVGSSSSHEQPSTSQPIGSSAIYYPLSPAHLPVSPTTCLDVSLFKRAFSPFLRDFPWWQLTH